MFAWLELVLFVSIGCWMCTADRSSDKSLSRINDLHHIPPAEETAEKLMKYFLDSDSGHRLHKRQISSVFDVLYIIDSSSSISKLEFQRGVQAIQKLVNRSKLNSKHGVITIATRAKSFLNFTTRPDVAGKLGALKRTGGKTNTQDALELGYQMFTTSKYGARTGSFGRVLVITDGRSNIKRKRTERKAKKLKAAGIEVFVIAVGDYLDGMDELAKMASTTYAHMYRVEDMRGLIQVVKLIPTRRREQGGTNEFGGRSLGGPVKRSLLDEGRF